jgi:hypothetical protein
MVACFRDNLIKQNMIILNRNITMKKIIFTMMCLLLVMAGCKKSQTAGVVNVASLVPEGQVITPEELAKKWAELDIPVPKGGQKPDVVTFLQAFQKIWPTQVVANLLNEGANTDFTEVYNSDIGSATIVDRESGYALLAAGDSDEDCMGAAVLESGNEHLLFMVNVITTTPDRRDIPLHQALCCYDYDPKTETMKPVEKSVNKFQPKLENSALVYGMPMASRIIRIGEVDKNGTNETKWHFLEFDGNDFTEYDFCTDLELEEKVMGTWVNFDNKKPAVTFDISRNDEQGTVVSDCGVYGSSEYEAYVSVWEGCVSVEEMMDDEEIEEGGYDPNFKCSFVLNKQGKLVGKYFLRQNGGSESHGNITLEHGNPEDALRQ